VLSAQPGPAFSAGGDDVADIVSAAVPPDPDTMPISEVHYNQLQKASPWFHSFLPGHDREYLTGNWFGLRDRLAEKGITVSSSYVADVLGNPIGGRVKGTRYDSSLGADLNVDLGKLIDLKGTQFHISGIWRAGRSLSHDCIDNQFTASSIYGSEQVRLYSLYIEQALFGDRVDIKIGRLGAGDDFASSPVYWLYVNNAIDGNPISVPINVPFATYPTATWGVCTKIKLTDRILSKTGFYNGDPAVGRDAAHGMDFTLRLHRGVFYAQEFSYLNNQLKGDTGMPGNYKVGGYYHSGRSFVDNYQDTEGGSYTLSRRLPGEHSGDYGMYLHADQMVYREGGPGEDEGLTLFECVTLAPARITQFPFFFDAGLSYKGLLPKRNMDMTALGFAYGQWSEYISDREEEARDILGQDIQPQYYEIMLDLSYKIQVTPCFFIQPDTQYIIHPKGRSKADNAYVVGVRVGVNF
ncbi:MAG TPA: carbohydrate porin, partial [bacterium]|nr:carbohydrate porin [bacterium]